MQKVIRTTYSLLTDPNLFVRKMGQFLLDQGIYNIRYERIISDWYAFTFNEKRYNFSVPIENDPGRPASLIKDSNKIRFFSLMEPEFLTIRCDTIAEFKKVMPKIVDCFLRNSKKSKGILGIPV